MTSGIYELNFQKQLFYIGQAQDIAVRMSQHSDKLQKGSAAQKMQRAYNEYGLPDAKVLLYCHKDYLNIMEAYYINRLNNYACCLNTSIPYFDASINYDMLIRHNLVAIGLSDLIKHSLETTVENNSLKAELNLLTQQHNTKLIQLRVNAEAKLGKDNNLEYKELYSTIEEAYSQTQAELKKLQNRGLMQRIFNYD